MLGAAVDELAAHGIAGFSVTRVAARADVDKRSISSRWPDRRQLLTDAIATLVADVEQASTGTLRSDLERLVPTVAEAFSTPRFDILTRALREAREDPDLYGGFKRNLLDHVTAIVEHAFREAARRGELAIGVDPDWATDAFIGLVMARAMGIRARGVRVLGAGEQRAIVDYTLRSVTSPSA